MSEIEPCGPERDGAVISDCGRYRYLLWRTWDESLPSVGFIMLNPSTADASVDDPTIRRCIGFAKDWGFGGIQVGNLYAYRATKPGDLWNVADPYGPDNALYLQHIRGACQLLIAGWGAGADPGDGRRVARLLQPVHALGLTAAGHPRHPLYMPKSAKPEPYLALRATWAQQDAEKPQEGEA